MRPASEQPELALDIPPSPETIPINGRCTLKKEGSVCVVYVAGLPVHHWAVGDRMAEAYAMVCLVQCGYTDQNDVARAFGCSDRTLRRHQRRFELGGMARLERVGGRPVGANAAPGPWVRAAEELRRRGLSFRDIAHRLGIGKTAVGKWLERLGKPTRLVSPEASTGHSTGVSADPDPRRRLFDRVLARVGLLQDAEPIFAPGRRIPRAGVLLAVPPLEQSGIFAVAEEVYGDIGPAFYGLRTTMLTMLLMALLRIKRPEGLKEQAPPELGRLLGLDRAPEVKTLRRKLTRLAASGKAEVFGRELAQRRVARHGKAMGFLYVDGHVRVYHGQRRLPKAHVTRMRLSLPATTDYWVNDQRGDPLFVVTAEVNAGVVKMLPALLEEVRGMVGK